MTEQEAGYCMDLCQKFWDFWDENTGSEAYAANLWVWPRDHRSSASFSLRPMPDDFLRFRGVVCNHRLFLFVFSNGQCVAVFRYVDDGWAHMYDVRGNTMYRGTLR